MSVEKNAGWQVDDAKRKLEVLINHRRSHTTTLPFLLSPNEQR
jgi:hypothetical protein